MVGLTEQYLGSMMRAIVAFEIPIDRLEGKAKLSQNRDAVDQARVAEALAASGDPSAQATSRAMRS
jgi:transcriptional regulator